MYYVDGSKIDKEGVPEEQLEFSRGVSREDDLDLFDEVVSLSDESSMPSLRWGSIRL